jgi:spore coat polysaccharide biosynthesis predicted glycosyltransferase SpsG
MKIYFRADGNSNIGLGHIYRCIAVSEMLPSYLKMIFIIREPSEAIKNLINRYFSSAIFLDEVEFSDEADYISDLLSSNDIIILDGYNFNTQYQARLKANGVRIICIDDIHKYHFVSDVVFNHAGGVESTAYNVENYTKLFLGPEYAIVRSDFWNKPKISERRDDNVFVSLGGADPKNDLLAILKKAISKNKSLVYNVVTGVLMLIVIF